MPRWLLQTGPKQLVNRYGKNTVGLDSGMRPSHCFNTVLARKQITLDLKLDQRCFTAEASRSD